MGERDVETSHTSDLVEQRIHECPQPEIIHSEISKGIRNNQNVHGTDPTTRNMSLPVPLFERLVAAGDICHEFFEH